MRSMDTYLWVHTCHTGDGSGSQKKGKDWNGTVTYVVRC